MWSIGLFKQRNHLSVPVLTNNMLKKFVKVDQLWLNAKITKQTITEYENSCNKIMGNFSKKDNNDMLVLPEVYILWNYDESLFKKIMTPEHVAAANKYHSISFESHEIHRPAMFGRIFCNFCISKFHSDEEINNAIAIVVNSGYKFKWWGKETYHCDYSTAEELKLEIMKELLCDSGADEMPNIILSLNQKTRVFNQKLIDKYSSSIAAMNRNSKEENYDLFKILSSFK